MVSVVHKDGSKETLLDDEFKKRYPNVDTSLFGTAFSKHKINMEDDSITVDEVIKWDLQ